MHAEDPHVLVYEAVQGFKHETVAAERHDDFGFCGIDRAVFALQIDEGQLCRLGIGGDERDAG
jgi:hypothetical protein